MTGRAGLEPVSRPSEVFRFWGDRRRLSV